jgi:hypothetical protein
MSIPEIEMKLLVLLFEKFARGEAGAVPRSALGVRLTTDLDSEIVRLSTQLRDWARIGF